MTRYLVTGRMTGDGADGLAWSVNHMAPVTQFEAESDEAANANLKNVRPGEAIYHLRLWRMVEAREQTEWGKTK